MLLDGLLCGALLLLSVWMIAAPRLFGALVIFFVFGLLVALAWVRLAAVDIALTEAAIGAGLTGAFLLAAYARLRAAPADGAGHNPAAMAAAAAVALAVGAAVLALPPAEGGLAPAVEAQLAASGVANPVTAVLLNFRGYDTLLEIAVLLLAAVGAAAVGVEGAPRERPQPSVLLTAYLRAALPLMVVAAGYLLWAGSSGAGGAFQAGAVAAAAGILAALAPPFHLRFRRRPLSAAMALGPLVFAGTGLALLLSGRGFLDYPPARAGVVILAIEAAATVSIAAVFFSLFSGLLGAPPAGRRGREP